MGLILYKSYQELSCSYLINCSHTNTHAQKHMTTAASFSESWSSLNVWTLLRDHTSDPPLMPISHIKATPYGIQLWGTASTSNIDILERFQSKALRMIVDASWYVPNMVIRRDIQIPKVKEEIRRYSSQYSARLIAHPNDLIVNLIELPDNRRLRRHLPNDLPTTFLV
jgi:hypothetical protein